ncbi:MAG: glycosyltransferase family 1 protein [Sphingobacteriaceae bacterium]|nr:MAG: glycosyltransferase family 1 protein [Sphingobacteriaceae bacterium]
MPFINYKMSEKVILLTLQTFSTTGGIQKMTRVLGHSLNNIADAENCGFKMYSAYDSDSDLMLNYLPANKFRGFKGNKAAFTVNVLRAALKANVVILSHVNLAIVGVLIKLMNPACKIWLVAHGIEVWRPLRFFKKRLLNNCDKVICVSKFTRKQVMDIHGVDRAKCTVLNNVLDPFMRFPEVFERPAHLLKKYGLTKTDPVIFTLTRLASTEQYKGYEQVIDVVARLKKKFPKIKYILSGEYDEWEKSRLDKLIRVNDVLGQVILTGFINEEELSDHFLLADVFVLPSKKEGFGIVFIEAMACGLPVICGNADGSVDAIRNGELGTAIDANNLDELERSIITHLQDPLTTDKRKHLQQQCINYFSEEKYQVELQKMIIPC